MALLATITDSTLLVNGERLQTPTANELLAILTQVKIWQKVEPGKFVKIVFLGTDANQIFQTRSLATLKGDWGAARLVNLRRGSLRHFWQVAKDTKLVVPRVQRFDDEFYLCVTRK